MEGLMTVNLCDLQNKIESLKNRMIVTGLKHGLNHGKTIQISQELDALIFEYQHLIRN